MRDRGHEADHRQHYVQEPPQAVFEPQLLTPFGGHHCQHEGTQCDPARSHVPRRFERVEYAQRVPVDQPHYREMDECQPRRGDRQIAVKKIDNVDPEWRGWAAEPRGQRELHPEHRERGKAERLGQVPPERHPGGTIAQQQHE